MSIELEINKRDIATIDRRHKKMIKRDIERVTKHKIYIKHNRFVCINCGNTYMCRSKNHGMKERVTFYCQECKTNNTEIYDKKKGFCIDFKEYRKIIDKIAKGEKNV